MRFFHQLWDAVRGQIEDFFRVSPRAVAVMLVIVALLIFGVYWRTIHAIGGHSNRYWVVRDAVNVLVLALLLGARRFFKS